jgi:large subunit ribosomal protein L32
MPTPKYRTSASKRDMRRSHHALKTPGRSSCPSCGEIRQPHSVCGSCGFYNGKVVAAAKSAQQPIDSDFQ